MNSVNLPVSDLIAFLAAETLCHAVTLTFDSLTLKVCDTLCITWSKSVQNSSDIEQSLAD